MIIPDANLILYAHNSADPDHRSARLWWEELLSNQRPVGLSIVVVLAFLRLSTSPRVLQRPLTVEESADYVRSWFAVSSVHLIQPGRNHLRTLLELVCQSGSGGNLTTDAHLAALAIEHNAELHSNDRHFERYRGLRWRNPLQAGKRI